MSVTIGASRVNNTASVLCGQRIQMTFCDTSTGFAEKPLEERAPRSG